MGPVGVKGRRVSRVPCEVHGFMGLISRRSQQVSKVIGRQGLPCEVHGFKGLICQSSLKSFKVLGRQVSKVEGDPGLIMRFKVFRRSLKVNGFKNILIQGLQGSKG